MKRQTAQQQAQFVTGILVACDTLLDAAASAEYLNTRDDLHHMTQDTAQALGVVLWDGKAYASIDEAAADTGLSAGQLKYRVDKGYTSNDEMLHSGGGIRVMYPPPGSEAEQEWHSISALARAYNMTPAGMKYKLEREGVL